MLLEIPPKMSVSSFMGYLKGKSSLMIFEQWGNARYQYRNREFWCRGYYVDTVGKNTKAIKEYIQNQLKEDAAASQLTMEEIDPFTGSKCIAKGTDILHIQWKLAVGFDRSDRNKNQVFPRKVFTDFLAGHFAV